MPDAHAIIESYDEDDVVSSPASTGSAIAAGFSPSSSSHGGDDEWPPPFATFNFSAASEKSLVGMLQSYVSYLSNEPATSMTDLSWTLNCKRSTLPVRVSVAASTAPGLLSKLQGAIEDPAKARLTTASASASAAAKPARLLGVFTGQGAQWAGMLAALVRTNQIVSDCLDRLQLSLDTLPEPLHRPSWTLKAELLKDSQGSNIGRGEFSQPLVTAVQLCVLELLRSAGIRFTAVVGHSAGETAAACAAGYLTPEDAIRVAYYRGYFLRLARGAGGAPVGGMLAAGSSCQDLEALCKLPLFRGKINIAAYNSPESCTLSGDVEAITEAQDILEEEGKFARRLRLDLPYHSQFMIPCSGPYTAALEASLSGIRPREQREVYPTWISSVYAQDIEEAGPEAVSSVAGAYWSKNLCSPVMFSQALEYALGAHSPFDLAVEVGPHAALRSPALQTIAAVTCNAKPIPYTGTLSRGKHDGEAFAEALGSMWLALGEMAGVDHTSFIKKALRRQPRLLKNLSPYHWDHDREYWAEPRHSVAFRAKGESPHQLLGVRCADGTEPDQVRWKNVLSVREVPWLKHHTIQGQVVFPAAGYISAAVEAVVSLYGRDQVQLIDFSNVEIGRGLILQENAGTESVFSLRVASPSSPRGFKAHLHGSRSTTVDADFSMHSASGRKDTNAMTLHASGRMRVTIRNSEESQTKGLEHLSVAGKTLPPPIKPMGASFGPLEPRAFYEAMEELGIGYSGPFAKLLDTGRRLEEAVGTIEKPSISADNQAQGSTPLLVHPGTLDCAIQAILLAFCYPGDGRMKTIFLPTRIERLRIDPLACGDPPGSKLPFYASLSSSASSITPSSSVSVVSGDVEVHSADGKTTIFQLQGLHATPLERPSSKDDFRIFSEMVWGPATPTGNARSGEAVADTEQLTTLERVALYYLKMLVDTFPVSKRAGLEKHHLSLLAYAEHSVDWVASGTHPFGQKEWVEDSRHDILDVVNSTAASIDLRLMRAVGESITSVFRHEMNILEAMTVDDMLGEFYRTALGMEHYMSGMVRMVRQLTHRFPHLDILEIGAGTGGATSAILGEVGEAFASYTYTDISSGFFARAQQRFEQQHGTKMVYKTLDIERDPAGQGYAPHSFDLVVASLVLHATVDLEQTMANVRKLLRPGGYLVMVEISGNYDPARVMRLGFIFGSLPGWWRGRETDRKMSPCVSVARWEELMLRTGFSSVDAVVPHSDAVPMPFTVMACQAVDDRIRFLRQPLASGSQTTSLGVENLTIIGSNTPTTAALAEQILNLVVPHYQNQVKIVRSLDDVSEPSSLPTLGTVVSLVDLEDAPVFRDLEDSLMPQKLSAFKNVFERSKNVLWVATGTYDGQQPYNAMIVGFQRTLVLEIPHLRFQHLDLAADTIDDDDDVANLIAEKLLQLEATDAWEKQDGHPVDHLWYTEPALSIQKGGAELVPRIRHNARRNSRYNAGRRVVTRDVDLDDVGTVVSLRPHSGLPNRRNRFTVGEKTPLLGEDRGSSSVTGGSIEIEACHSLLRPLPILDSTRPLYMCVGRDSRTGEHVVALMKSLDSRVDAADAWAAPTRFRTEGHALDAMLSLYTHLLAHAILRGVPAGRSVVVLSADYALGAVLSRRAAEKGIQLALLTTEAERTKPWTYAHPLATKESVMKLLPVDAARFVDMVNHAGDDGEGGSAGHEEKELVAVILSCLRPGCSAVSWDSLMGVGAPRDDSAVWPDGAPATAFPSDAVEAVLRTAWAASQAEPASPGSRYVPALSLVDIARAQSQEGQTDHGRNLLLSKKLSGQAVVSWKGSSHSNKIPVQIQPASSMVRFAADKTYWLVGLSGGLGLSLAEWMARRGAHYIVISSRNPKVEDGWLDAMATAHGCTIRVFASDVASRDDVRCLHRHIIETLPPIAGVAHGAMVLDDTTFQDLDMERLAKVLRPKVDSSLHLDEIFSPGAAGGAFGGDDLTRPPPLGFFVFLSSVAYVVGNQGQSAHAAANAFIAALARRRRSLGLAASVVNIGEIVGKGYFSREVSTAGKAAIFRLGNQFMSEHDFHEMFAECILASQCVSDQHGMPATATATTATDGSPEISTGIRRLKMGEDLPLWAPNPIFHHLVPKASSHLVGRDGAAAGRGGRSNARSSVTIQAQLLEATAAEQVFAIFRDGLLAKLQMALHADLAKLKIEQGLDELGVDSLVAVDLRSWFLKELGVDMPVLKILNSASVKELLEAGQDLLPASMVPKLNKNAPDGSASALNPPRVPVAASTAAPYVPASLVGDHKTSTADSSDERSDASYQEVNIPYSSSDASCSEDCAVAAIPPQLPSPILAQALPVNVQRTVLI